MQKFHSLLPSCSVEVACITPSLRAPPPVRMQRTGGRLLSCHSTGRPSAQSLSTCQRGLTLGSRGKLETSLWQTTRPFQTCTTVEKLGICCISKRDEKNLKVPPAKGSLRSAPALDSPAVTGYPHKSPTQENPSQKDAAVVPARSVRNALDDKPAGPSGEYDITQVKGLTAAGNNRSEKVVEAIEAWNKALHPDLRQEKYAKMAISPFLLYRGTAHLFWGDFSGDWRLCRFGNPRTRTWLLGDMHAYNMGAFYSPGGQLCYGLNDFDESMLGDYQYDVWRLGISIAIIARENGDLTAEEQERVIHAFALSYLKSLVTYKRSPEGRQFTSTNTYGKLKTFLDVCEHSLGRDKMLGKWCRRTVNGDVVSFNYDLRDRLVATTAEERAAILDAFSSYHNVGGDANSADVKAWNVKDVARRLSSGTGSLGVPRYYLLVDEPHPDKPRERQTIILDVKGQPKPAAYYFLSAAEQLEYDSMYMNDAQRHALAAVALRPMQERYNGWLQIGEDYFSVRERSPYKQAYPCCKGEAKGAFKGLELNNEKKLTAIAKQWGSILATEHAHARHDFDGAVGRFKFRQEVDRLTLDHREEFCHLVWQVSRDYAMQVERDWGYFMAALAPDDH